MKKLYFILTLVVISFMMVFAGDTVKILRIYHDGTFTAIPLANIDSISHTKYDANGIPPYNTSSIIEAIDSTYNIPISEIDSVVVTEADIEEYNAYTEKIRKYLFAQEEQPVDQYQSILLEWLEKCDFVLKATLTGLKDKIIVEFPNGMDFYINFVDLSNYSDNGSEDPYGTRNVKSASAPQKYFDVSSLPEEEIIKPNILYLQGRSMPSKEDEFLRSNADKEWKDLYREYEESPVDGKLIKISKSFSFIGEDFSKYGLFIISQTHGDSNRSGKFQVEDDSEFWKAQKRRGIIEGINVYLYLLGTQMVCHTTKDEPTVYWFYPEYLKNRLNNLVYGSYCYSSDLNRKFDGAIVYGYNSTMWYGYGIPRKTPGKDSLIVRMNRFFNGYTYKDAVWLKSYNVNGDIQIPKINNPYSIHRLFSIKTEDIEVGEGIKGEIKGFQNLKKDVNYMLYVHEGREKFTPEDSDVEKIENAVNPGTDGCFTISSDIVNQYPDHAFIVGFEYADKVYYGEMKTVGIELCPDDNHPHAIDLGLPSGTKWACSNVGASKPEEYGGYFAWGETEEKGAYTLQNYTVSDFDPYFSDIDIANTQYDVAHVHWGGLWHMPTKEQCEELIDNCTYAWIKINDISGMLFKSSINGRSIFFPAAGSPGYGEEGHIGFYWSSYNYYCFNLKNLLPLFIQESYVWGLSVRPVLTQL